MKTGQNWPTCEFKEGMVELGDRVKVNDTPEYGEGNQLMIYSIYQFTIILFHIGVVKFIGKMDTLVGKWVGIELQFPGTYFPLFYLF